MAAITAELNLEISRFRRNLQSVNRMLAGFARQGDAQGRAHGKHYGQGFNASARRELQGMFKGLGGLLAVSSIGFAIGREFASAMKDAASRERFEIGVSALTQSATQGDELFEHFRAEAKRTGSDIEDLLLSARRAIGQGMSVADTKQLTKSILDIQGSLALTNEEARLLTQAILQVRSKGTVAMEELRQQIGEKGVPIFETLMNELDLHGKDFTDAVAEGLIPADVLLDVFMNLRGEFQRFSGGAEKMAQTLGGAWNILAAQWKDLRIEFSEPIADAIRPILREAGELLDTLDGKASGLGERFADGIRVAHTAIKELGVGGSIELIADILRAKFISAVLVLQEGLLKVLKAIADPSNYEGISKKLKELSEDLASMLKIAFLDAMSTLYAHMKEMPMVGKHFGNASAAAALARNDEENKLADRKWNRAVNGSRDQQTPKWMEALHQIIYGNHKDLNDLQGSIEFRKFMLAVAAEEAKKAEAQKVADLKKPENEVDPIQEAANKVVEMAKMQTDMAYQADQADLANFPGLRDLANLQKKGPFGGAFGSPFTGVAGGGGFGSPAANQVSLGAALDYALGESGPYGELKKSNEALGKIEEYLREMKEREIPQPDQPTEAVFVGRGKR